MQAAFVAVFLASAAIPSQVQARTGLVQSKSTLRATANVDLFQKNLRDAIGDMLGCGQGNQQNDLDTIEKKVLPIWNSLPKSANGRIERPLLRYIVYRYFMGTSSLVIRGFEQSSPVNESAAHILSQQVPAYVEAVLQSQHAQDHGFDLQDAVHVVALLRKLIADSDTQALETIYNLRGEKTNVPLSRYGLHVVLRDYLVQWLMFEDSESLKEFQRHPERLNSDFPQWHRIMMFRDGLVKTFDYNRHRAGKGFSQYTFSDVQEIISSIRSSFAYFWDDMCIEMRTMLVNMDTYKTGRVPLKMFYSRPFSREWRFAESEDYLRQLGALDETSLWHSSEVIIPGSADIAAASNCAVVQPHYLVCCADFCDGIFSELEAGVGGPVAPPEQILNLVGNMSRQNDDLDDEENPRLRGSLSRQLDKIAAAHGGQVPLHGRLFAQWLHYAFPRECPFPHKSGSTKQVLPKSFEGDHYIVREEDRLRHLGAEPLGMPIEIEKDTMQWMSQWSSEEELLSDYTTAMRDPSAVDWLTVAGVVIFLAALAAGVVGARGQSGASTHRKSHFV
ncbi:unnamed protein product [Prorocentrum cordatum]|uniref:Uncharacterized protein n=1 Tax=Prorocentrum cordatum TaxID=2364126 RepID=A0ABN9S4W5_9DINO|nr:unnamed protein product [Polarella glacialis]